MWEQRIARMGAWRPPLGPQTGRMGDSSLLSPYQWIALGEPTVELGDTCKRVGGDVAQAAGFTEDRSALSHQRS